MMNLALANVCGDNPRLAGPFHLLAPYPNPWLKSHPRIEDTNLPKDFPDYLVYMTRKSLYAATTSLSKVSAKVHDFFLRLNAILAFERMVRSFWSWSAVPAAPWLYGIDQPWLRPALHKQPALLFWEPAMPALTRSQNEQKPTLLHTTPEMASMFPIFVSSISASMAFLAFAPSLIQCWAITR